MPAKATTKTTKKAPAKKAAAKKPAAKKPRSVDPPERTARPAWKGSISFGLIHIPVMLFGVATKRRISFNQLHRKDGARIKQKRYCAVEDVEVPYEDIVKGYEISPGNYVVIEPDELSAIAPERSRAIELEKFIDASEIDPLYYDASYFVLPDKGSEQPYALLREAMAAEKRAAVARLVIHQKEHLVALWPRDDVLIVSTLHFAQEVADPNKFDTEGAPKKATNRTELQAARQLISALSDGFQIGEYQDEYREQVLDLIEAKAKGKKIAKAPEAEAPKATSDLMSALEESLASLGDGRSRGRTRGSKGQHKTAAKKHTAAKKTKTSA